jgi:hypothetical protein
VVYKQAKIPTFETLDQAGQFFQNELSKIADAFTETRELELRESFREPERPRDGMIIFADGTHWDPGNGRGPYYFDSSWTPFVTGGGGGYTDEQARDAIAAAFAAGTQTGITITYNDVADSFDFTVAIPPAYTDEEAQDAVGSILVDSARIDFTYNDGVPSITADIIANSIGDTFLRQGAAMSVIGRSANSVGDVADIAATTAGQILRVNTGGTAIAFGLILSTSVSDFTEASQDSIGAMVGPSLVYVDATPLLARAALTGDVTAAQDSNATTLATVNANVGTFGSATQVAQVTLNAKGLATAASNVAIAIASTAVTDFAEAAQDNAAAMLIAGTHTNLTYNYNDAGNAFDISINDVFLFNTGDTFTGALVGPNGTETDPTFDVNGQGGLFSQAAGNLSITVNDDEFVRFDGTNDRVAIGPGGFDPIEVFHLRATTAARMLFQSEAGTVVRVQRVDASGAASNASQFVLVRSRGNFGAIVNPNVNDLLGTFGFAGSDNETAATAWNAVELRASALSPTPSTTDRLANLQVFLGTTGGGATLTETMRLHPTSGWQAFGANTVLDANRLLQERVTTIAGAVAGAQGKHGYFSDAAGGQGDLVIHDGTRYKNPGDGGYVTVATNADYTWTHMATAANTRHTGTLTADRTVTLSTTNAYPGAKALFTRTGAGAFNLSIGGLKNLVTNTWCMIVYDGSAWYLAAYGAL